MAENFYTVLTNAGMAAFANAQVSQGKVDFYNIAVGDSNGAYYNPVATATKLANEVWRGPINSISIDETNPNWVIVEAVIPATAGGFSVREIGVFDTAGILLAIGKVPETYKPATAQGSLKDLYLRMILEVSNASAVTLKVDPAVIFASKKYVDDKVASASQNTAQLIERISAAFEELKKGNTLIPDLETDNKKLAGSINEINKKITTTQQLFTEHLDEKATTTTTGHVQLSSDTNSTSETLAATPKAVKEVSDVLDTHTKNDTAHGIGNKAELLTAAKDTIVNSINELFTNVSNGKTLIGTAITDTDPSKKVPSNPTFNQLSDLIRGIKVARKEAKGEAISDSKGIMTVSGLAFKPSIIIFHQKTTYADKRPIGLYLDAKETLENKTINLVTSTNNYYDTNLIIVNQNSFTVDTLFAISKNYYWIAFE